MITAKYAHDAAKSGNIENIMFVIETYPALALTPDEENNTLLHIAAQHGQVLFFEFLYDILLKIDTPEPEINKRNNNQHTSLMVACIEGHEKIVQCILKSGHNPNETDPSPIIAAMTAPIDNQVKILDLLLTHGADPNELSGVAIDQAGNRFKVTPLIAALFSYSCDKNACLQRLLDHPGLDVNQSIMLPSNPPTETNPLWLAVNQRLPAEIIIKLLELNAHYPASIYPELISEFIAAVNKLNFSTFTIKELRPIWFFIGYIEANALKSQLLAQDDYTILKICLLDQFSHYRAVSSVVPSNFVTFLLSEEYRTRALATLENYRTWCRDNRALVHSLCDENEIEPCIISTELPDIPVFVGTKVYCYDNLLSYTRTKIEIFLQRNPQHEVRDHIIADPLKHEFFEEYMLVPHPEIFQELKLKISQQSALPRPSMNRG